VLANQKYFGEPVAPIMRDEYKTPRKWGALGAPFLFHENKQGGYRFAPPAQQSRNTRAI
jgi:hypothetical protein